jgi:hypothetical protein
VSRAIRPKIHHRADALLRPVAPALAVLAAAAWALAPLGPEDVPIPTAPKIAPQSSEPTTAAQLALDVSAFRVPLWVAPPTPPTPPRAIPPSPAPAPLTPLKLALLAIVHEGPVGGDTYRALLYDPDADRILALTQGQQAGGRTVELVTAASVQIRDDAGLHTLALNDTASPPGGKP